jgi:hypothetical protein
MRSTNAKASRRCATLPGRTITTSRCAPRLTSQVLGSVAAISRFGLTSVTAVLSLLASSLVALPGWLLLAAAPLCLAERSLLHAAHHV